MFSLILRRGEPKFCLQRFQTQIIRFCSQNFDKLGNSKVNICVYMRITFDPDNISKIWQQNRIFCVWKPCRQNFRPIYLKIKKTFISTNRMVRRLCLRAVLVGAKYFYYPDSWKPVAKRLILWLSPLLLRPPPPKKKEIWNWSTKTQKRIYATLYDFRSPYFSSSR